MKPGKKPYPTNLKVLSGVEKRYINQNEPKFETVDNIKIPEYFLDETKKQYAKLFKALKDKRVLTEVDILEFDKMMEHWEFANRALRMLKKGLFTKDERGLPRKHPANQVYRENSLAFLRYASGFGLDPSSRSRISIDTKDEIDEFDEYLNLNK